MIRHGLLFDLDGTLADTAPDLVAVLNAVLLEAGRPPVPYAIARNAVSHGAVGLIRLGFGLAPDAPVDDDMRSDFIASYEKIGHNNSRLFISLEDINNLCSRYSAGWGIVTNKPEGLTRTLLRQLGVLDEVATLVCGDTLPVRKPHPAPLQRAAGELGVDCERCVYIGDAERDIQAGRAAGMRTIATSYGYIRPSENIAAWAPDAVAEHPRRIAAMLDQILQAD